MDGAGNVTIASSMTIAGGTLGVTFAPGAGTLSLYWKTGRQQHDHTGHREQRNAHACAANSYGNTVISGGTLNVTATNNFGSTSGTITLENGGTLLDSSTGNFAATSSYNNLNIVDYGTIDVANSTSYINYYPNFSGTGTLTKTGPGMVWCHGSGNVQAGPFIIAQGVFLTTSRRTTYTTSMTVQPGGQWEMNNNRLQHQRRVLLIIALPPGQPSISMASASPTALRVPAARPAPCSTPPPPPSFTRPSATTSNCRALPRSSSAIARRAAAATTRRAPATCT